MLLEKCSFIFEELEKSGFECFAVGGCVRDLLLNKTPDDIDFTTNAKPDEILACFKNYKTYELGKKYGTITVLKDNIAYEITTYRIDGNYLDSRHPEKVSFSKSLREDLSRRDFTVNAMAMDKFGNVIDYYNGKDDLKAGLIRTVGNPRDRFSEDALRILRAIRFSAKLGFEIEPNTSDACKTYAYLLNSIPMQRFGKELDEFIVCPNAPFLLDEYRQVFAVLIPELKPCFDFSQITPHHRYDVYTHTLKALSHAPLNRDIRLALLLHDVAKPLCVTTDKAGITHFNGHPHKSSKIAKSVLSRFAYPSAVIAIICKLIEYHDFRFEKPRLHLKRTLTKLSEDEIRKLLVIQRCDALAQSEYLREEKLSHIDVVEKELDALLRENSCIKLKDLAVNGNDILALGAKNKLIGKVLEHLMNLVIEEKLPNSRDELLIEAEKYISFDTNNDFVIK